MDDATDGIRTVAHNQISEETKESLRRLFSAWGCLLGAPAVVFALRPMIGDAAEPVQVGIGITAMALPETLALVWAVKVMREEKNVWRKARHRRHRALTGRVAQRLLFLAVALAIPASIAVTIWFF